MSEDQNLRNNPNRFYILSGVWSAILSLISLLVGVIVGLAAYLFDVTFAMIISFAFPTLCVYISKKITDFILKFAKNGVKKGQIMFISIVLFVLKYIVIVIPLIVGLIVNASTKTLIFNPYALVIAALIYPATSLIVQWYFMGKQKKGAKQDE